MRRLRTQVKPWLTRVKPWLDPAFLVLGLGLFAWALSRYPLGALAAACAHMGPLVALTGVVVLIGQASSASALASLLPTVPWRTLLWTRLSAEGYNSLVAGVGGEPLRARVLGRFAPGDEVVAAMLRDRVVDVASSHLLSAVFLLIGLGRFALPAALGGSLGAYAVVVAVASLAGVALVLTRLPGHLGARLGRWLGGVAGTPPAPLGLGRFVRLLGWYALCRLLGLVEIGVCLWLLGLGVRPLETAFLDAALNAAGTIGFLVPQAIGVYESASVLLFTTLGLGGPAGVVFSLARRARMLALSLGGIALYALSTRLNSRAAGAGAAPPSPR